MALRWNVSNIDNFEEVCYREYCENCEQYWPPDAECVSRWGKEFDGHKKADGVKLHYITEALIWTTIAVDMGSITEDNWKEFFTRLRFEERMFGNKVVEKGEPRFITAQEVRDHIGLSVNVTTESRARWLKKVMKQFENDLHYELRKVDDGVSVRSGE